MPEISDIKTLEAVIKEAVDTALVEDVAPVIENILRQHIKTDIYGRYKRRNGGYFGGKFYATKYSRRHVLEKEILSTVADGLLETTSTASPNEALLDGYSTYGGPGAFFEMLESDERGLWTRGFPRPVVSKAQKEVDDGSDAVTSFINGLQRIFGA